MHNTPHAFGWQHLWRAIGLLLPVVALASSPLDINTATEADLDSLKGVGPATTARLLAERQQSPFTSWADLMARVKGIKGHAAAKLSAQGLTVNGQPYPTATSQSTPAEAPQ